MGTLLSVWWRPRACNTVQWSNLLYLLAFTRGAPIPLSRTSHFVLATAQYVRILQERAFTRPESAHLLYVFTRLLGSMGIHDDLPVLAVCALFIPEPARQNATSSCRSLACCWRHLQSFAGFRWVRALRIQP